MIILTGWGRAVHEGWERAEAQPSWQETCTIHYDGSVSKTEASYYQEVCQLQETVKRGQSRCLAWGGAGG